MKHLVLSAAAAVAVASCSVAHAGCYSEGTRVGIVQKLSNKGLVVKSYEGELVMDGEKIRGSGGYIRGGNVWKFSAQDTDVAKKLDQSMNEGRPVAVKY